MEIITRKQYESIPKDYRGIMTGFQNPEHKGLRSCFAGSLAFLLGKDKADNANGTTLLIEGMSFKIIN